MNQHCDCTCSHKPLEVNNVDIVLKVLERLARHACYIRDILPGTVGDDHENYHALVTDVDIIRCAHVRAIINHMHVHD